MKAAALEKLLDRLGIPIYVEPRRFQRNLKAVQGVKLWWKNFKRKRKAG